MLFFYRMAQSYAPTLVRPLLAANAAPGRPATTTKHDAITEIQVLSTWGVKAVSFSGILDVYVVRELDLNVAYGFFVSNLAGRRHAAFPTWRHPGNRSAVMHPDPHNSGRCCCATISGSTPIETITRPTECKNPRLKQHSLALRRRLTRAA